MLFDIVKHTVDVVEFADELLQRGGGQLFDNVVLNQLDKQIVSIPARDVLVTWEFGALLLLLFFALFLALLLFLAFLFSKHHHVCEFLFDHLIDNILLFLFDLWTHR